MFYWFAHIIFFHNHLTVLMNINDCEKIFLSIFQVLTDKIIMISELIIHAGFILIFIDNKYMQI